MQKPSLQEKERATATAKTISSTTAKFGNIYGNGCKRDGVFAGCYVWRLQKICGAGFIDARAESSSNEKRGLKCITIYKKKTTATAKRTRFK